MSVHSWSAADLGPGDAFRVRATGNGQWAVHKLHAFTDKYCARGDLTQGLDATVPATLATHDKRTRLKPSGRSVWQDNFLQHLKHKPTA